MTDTEYDFLFKIVLTGKSGVGKSGCLSRYYKNDFVIGAKTTIGVEFATKNVNIDNKIVKAQIWDTAGQERYRAITSAYYRGSVGIIFVYDITNFDSFTDIERWKKEVRANLPDNNIEMLLLGNKKDLEHIRAVNREEAEAYATANSMMFSEVSALNGFNIEKVIDSFVKKIYTRISTYVEPTVPDSTPEYSVPKPICIKEYTPPKSGSCCS